MATASLDVISGLAGGSGFKSPCVAATTGNVSLSGLSAVDGYTPLPGDRILVWQQSNPVENGIWNAASGAWTRAIDCDGRADIFKGTQVAVANGATYSGSIFMVDTANPITVGVTGLFFIVAVSALVQAAIDAAAAAEAAAASMERARISAPYGSGVQTEVIIDNADYSHFPSGFVANNGDLCAVYYHSRFHHGQANVTAVSTYQAVAAAGALSIDGDEASGGSVTLAAATRLNATTTGANSGKTITFNGTNAAGASISSTVTLGNGTVAAPVSSTTAVAFKTVTSVTASAAMAGTVAAGAYMLPSNIEFRVSKDWGATWGDVITVADGLTDGRHYYYAPVAGLCADGSAICIFLKFDIEAATPYQLVYSRAATPGAPWGEPIPVVYSGISPGSTLAFYGNIAVLPSGALVASAYSGFENYAMISEDHGATWTGHVVVSSGTVAVPEAICLSQSLGAAGSLTINGSGASGGRYNFVSAGRVTLNSVSGDNRGVTFTITGFDTLGAPQSVTTIGANTGATITTSQYWTAVTGISTNAATVGDVKVGSTSPNYSEQSIACVDENQWIAVLRLDASTGAMRQFKTLNRGVTWTDQGALNIPVTGGNASPMLYTVRDFGGPHILLMWMSRDSTSLPAPAPFNEAIVAVVGLADDLFASSTAWGPESVIYDVNLIERSGYPAVFLGEGGNAFVAIGRETVGIRTSEIIGVRSDITSLIPLVRDTAKFGSATVTGAATLTEVNTTGDVFFSSSGSGGAKFCFGSEPASYGTRPWWWRFGTPVLRFQDTATASTPNSYFEFYDSAGTMCGYQGMVSGYIESNSTNGGHHWRVGGAVKWSISASTFSLVPGTDNALDIGSGALRINEIYLANAPVVTSQRDMKQDIDTIDDDLLDAADTLKPVAYRMKSAVAKKGDEARRHFGLIAEDFAAALAAHGVPAESIAAYCADNLEDGSKRLALRYDEVTMLFIAALLRRIERLEGKD